MAEPRKDAVLYVRIPATLHRTLKSRAAKEDRTLSQLVQRMLREGVAKR